MARKPTVTSDLWHEALSNPDASPVWDEVVQRLQPSSAHRDRLAQTFTRVRRALEAGPDDKDQALLAGHSLVKGGSFGKDTFLPDRNEIDVVVTLAAFDASNMKRSLEVLQQCIEARLGTDVVRKSMYCSQHAVQFQLQCGHQVVDVDLLPCAALPNGAQSFVEPDADVKYPSASASALQRNFIRRQGQHYRDCVRVVKFWRNQSHWSDKRHRPASYLLELLVVHVLRRSTSSSSSSSSSSSVHPAAAVLIDVLRLVRDDFAQLKIVFDDEYSESLVDWSAFKLPAVIDPANPTNNLIAGSFDASEFVANANQSLALLLGPPLPKSDPRVVALHNRVETLVAQNNKLQQSVESLQQTVASLQQTVEGLQQSQTQAGQLIHDSRAAHVAACRLFVHAAMYQHSQHGRRHEFAFLQHRDLGSGLGRLSLAALRSGQEMATATLTAGGLDWQIESSVCADDKKRASCFVRLVSKLPSQFVANATVVCDSHQFTYDFKPGERRGYLNFCTIAAQIDVRVTVNSYQFVHGDPQ